MKILDLIFGHNIAPAEKQTPPQPAPENHLKNWFVGDAPRLSSLMRTSETGTGEDGTYQTFYSETIDLNDCLLNKEFKEKVSNIRTGFLEQSEAFQNFRHIVVTWEMISESVGHWKGIAHNQESSGDEVMDAVRKRQWMEEKSMSDLIPAEHLKIEPWPPRQIGGQQVGLIERGVKVTHIPTGIEACCSSARSQVKNKIVAISMIECALTHPSL